MLILDEPTNHLDIESREALEDALRAFTGAILLVSHDRALLDAVGTRTVAVEDGSLHSYVGGWPEYVRVRDERAGRAAAGRTVGRARRHARAARHARPNGAAPRRTDAAVGAATPTRSAQAQAEAPRAPSQEPPSAQQKAERAIEAAEAALRALEAELADPAAWATRYEAAKSEARHTAATRAVEDGVRAPGGAASTEPQRGSARADCNERTLKTRPQRRDHPRDRRGRVLHPRRRPRREHFEARAVGRVRVGDRLLGLRMYREHHVALHGLGDRHRGAALRRDRAGGVRAARGARAAHVASTGDARRARRGSCWRGIVVYSLLAVYRRSR